MKRRRTEERGGKNPLFCVYAANTISGHLTKREQREKAAPKPQKTQPKVRKNEVSIAAFFLPSKLYFCAHKKCCPWEGMNSERTPRKDTKNRQGYF